MQVQKTFRSKWQLWCLQITPPILNNVGRSSLTICQTVMFHVSIPMHYVENAFPQGWGGGHRETCVNVIIAMATKTGISDRAYLSMENTIPKCECLKKENICMWTFALSAFFFPMSHPQFGKCVLESRVFPSRSLANRRTLNYMSGFVIWLGLEPILEWNATAKQEKGNLMISITVRGLGCHTPCCF